MGKTDSEKVKATTNGSLDRLNGLVNLVATLLADERIKEIQVDIGENQSNEQVRRQPPRICF